MTAVTPFGGPAAAQLPGALLEAGMGFGVAPGSLSLAAFFLVGLFGGAHCIGMCGPLVTTYADHLRADGAGRARGATPGAGGRDRRLTGREVRQHALFNVGRTLGYAGAGALMGGLGALAFDAAAVVRIARPLQATVGLVIGGGIVLTGLSYVVYGNADLGRIGRVVGLGSGGLFARATAVLSSRVADWVGGPRIVGLGLVHAVLPCPLLYPAYLYALATGSPATGAVSLAALGLGTFPAVFGVATVFGAVDSRTRLRIQRALGVAFVAMGYVLLAHGLMFVGIHVPHPTFPHYTPG